jgi:deoxyribodipyrimidine photo-lyase
VQAPGDPPKPLPEPDTLRPGPNLASDTVESRRLEPTRPDWAGGLRDTWTPGELAGRQRLVGFLRDGAAGYTGGRDRPDHDSTSRLSPHLHFGETSPRRVRAS